MNYSVTTLTKSASKERMFEDFDTLLAVTKDEDLSVYGRFGRLISWKALALIEAEVDLKYRKKYVRVEGSKF